MNKVCCSVPLIFNVFISATAHCILHTIFARLSVLLDMVCAFFSSSLEYSGLVIDVQLQYRHLLDWNGRAQQRILSSLKRSYAAIYWYYNHKEWTTLLY